MLLAEALQLVISECKPKAKIVGICEKVDEICQRVCNDFLSVYIMILFLDEVHQCYEVVFYMGFPF